MNYLESHITFIGLGTMGFAMATNLYKAGYSLTVWNRNKARTQAFVSEFDLFKSLNSKSVDQRHTVNVVDNLKGAISGASVVLYSLADDDAIEQVVFSKEGILTAACKEQLFINLSTVHPDMSRREAKAYKGKGAAFLDAPVFGSLPEAEAADLCLVIGGDQKSFKSAEPILKAISSSRYHLGGVGQGASMGLIGSLMVCMQLQALGEGLTLAQKAGLDVKKVVEILGLPDFRSPLFLSMGGDLIKRKFDSVFSLSHLYKDARQILRLAEQLGVVMPGCSAVHEVIKSAITHGWENENASAMIKALELQSNTIIQSKG